MADKKVVDWITINGNHIPIYEGETKNDAFNRAVKERMAQVKADEDKKKEDIERVKKSAAEYNEKRNGGKKDDEGYEILGEPDKLGTYRARNKNGEIGRVIKGKFYSNKYLDNLMKTPEGRDEFQRMLGKEPVKRESDDDKQSTPNYSFSQDSKLSDIEKGWLEQAVDWANGEDNLPMSGMNTIARYYGVKFGKSASIISGINDKGDVATTSMNKALLNQAYNAIKQLKQAIKEKESKNG